MDTLVAMSTGIAYIFSVFNTLFPEFWISRGLEPHVYFEAAGVIIAFILVGKLMEEKAKSNTSSAIKKLIGMQPKTVLKLDNNGNSVEVLIASIQIGDIVLVRPCDKIGVEVEVITGRSFIDESNISGAPIAVAKKEGDQLLSGNINQICTIQFRSTKVAANTSLS